MSQMARIGFLAFGLLMLYFLWQEISLFLANKPYDMKNAVVTLIGACICFFAIISEYMRKNEFRVKYSGLQLPVYQKGDPAFIGWMEIAEIKFEKVDIKNSKGANQLYNYFILGTNGKEFSQFFSGDNSDIAQVKAAIEKAGYGKLVKILDNTSNLT